MKGFSSFEDGERVLELGGAGGLARLEIPCTAPTSPSFLHSRLRELEPQILQEAAWLGPSMRHGGQCP
jgi:hypothetical protein